MKIYHAGAVTGNLNSFYRDIANGNSVQAAMKIFLAGKDGYRADRFKLAQFNVLESYYYLRNHEWIWPLIPKFQSFMLDSGAFSFFGTNKEKIDWRQYAQSYGEFVKLHDIELFVELDVEKLVGMDEVANLRKIIGKYSGRKPIEVWRPSRGLEFFDAMIKRNNYVAISASGMYDSAWSRKKGADQLINFLCKKAHAKKCKVHGLGFTKLSSLDLVQFDSVDSSAWLYGNRGGYVYRFTGKGLKQVRLQGKRLLPKPAALHNFMEWVKFSRYAEKNL